MDKTEARCGLVNPICPDKKVKVIFRKICKMIVKAIFLQGLVEGALVDLKGLCKPCYSDLVVRGKSLL